MPNEEQKSETDASLEPRADEKPYFLSEVVVEAEAIHLVAPTEVQCSHHTMP
jgi:hypothetical protein